MRVLLITGSFPPIECGVGDYLYQLAKAIGHRGDVKTAVLTSTAAEPLGEGSDVELFRVMDSWSIGRIFRVVRVIRRWKPDLVHVQYPSSGYWFAPGRFRTLMQSLLPLAAFLSGCKVVQTWHEYERHSPKTLGYFMLRALVPSTIIVVRPNFREHFSRFVRRLLRHKRIVQIPGASSIPKLDIDAVELESFRELQLGQQQRLIVFFGFIYPNKGADQLLDIANPKTDKLVYAGGYEEGSHYINMLRKRINSSSWHGKVDVLGYTTSSEVSMLLAAADAVVLPFRGNGGGAWNSSLQAALSHGCFLITTSLSRRGYDSEANTYYAEVDNTEEMKQALDNMPPQELKARPAKTLESDWQRIAAAHVHVYQQSCLENVV